MATTTMPKIAINIFQRSNDYFTIFCSSNVELNQQTDRAAKGNLSKFGLMFYHLSISRICGGCCYRFPSGVESIGRYALPSKNSESVAGKTSRRTTNYHVLNQ
jgi:hypothetical protein